MVCKWYRSLARYDKLFEFLSGIFLGKFFFANLIGAVAPYSATIGAQFVKVCRTPPGTAALVYVCYCLREGRCICTASTPLRASA
jgi:hypothetical protein